MPSSPIDKHDNGIEFNSKEEKMHCDKFIDILLKSVSDDDIKYMKAFKPQPTDYIISTFTKCGTTWMQQICHQLRSRGDMDFEEITYVIPYLALAYDTKMDLYKRQKYSPPQIYKAHLPYTMVPKGCRYIYVVRNPIDTHNSLYHHYGNWLFEMKDISIESFVKLMCIERDPKLKDFVIPGQFENLLSWYPHRLDKNVLWMHYEDMVQNRRKCISLVAEFLEISDANDTELIDLVERNTSRDFMLAHRSKFSDKPCRESINMTVGLCRSKALNREKVRAIRPPKENMDSKCEKMIEEKWLREVTLVTGHKTYSEMREAINKELNRNFL